MLLFFTAIQMLLAGANRDLVCNALVVTNRAIRKWINRFNQCGVDGLIVKKRPGRMAIINNCAKLFCNSSSN
jgi:transposase